MKVFVYFNLRSKLYSIKALEGPAKGRVVAHASDVIIKDATFKVSEAGRQRVLREKHKNVYAGVQGHLVSFKGTRTPIAIAAHQLSSNAWWLSCLDVDTARHAREVGTQVKYNPYLCGSFYRRVNDKAIPVSVRTFVLSLGYRHALLAVPVKSAPMVFMGPGEVFAWDPETQPLGDKTYG